MKFSEIISLLTKENLGKVLILEVNGEKIEVFIGSPVYLNKITLCYMHDYQCERHYRYPIYSDDLLYGKYTLTDRHVNIKQ